MNVAKTRDAGSATKGGAVQARCIRFWVAFETGVEFVCELFLKAATACLFFMMVLMTAYVITRKLGFPLPGAFHISQELIVLVFALPLGAITLNNAHIVFELVDQFFPSRIRRWLHAAGAAAGLAFFGVLGWKALQVGLAAAYIGEHQQGAIDVPVWIFRLALALALIVFALAILVTCTRTLRQPANADGEADDAI